MAMLNNQRVIIPWVWYFVAWQAWHFMTTLLYAALGWCWFSETVNPFKHRVKSLLSCEVRFGIGWVGSSQSVHNTTYSSPWLILKCKAVWNLVILVQDTKYSLETKHLAASGIFFFCRSLWYDCMLARSGSLIRLDPHGMGMVYDSPGGGEAEERTTRTRNHAQAYMASFACSRTPEIIEIITKHIHAHMCLYPHRCLLLLAKCWSIRHAVVDPLIMHMASHCWAQVPRGTFHGWEPGSRGLEMGLMMDPSQRSWGSQ